MIVEAKREGIYFSLPVGITSLVNGLATLTNAKDGKAFKGAIGQAASYCVRRGVQLAAVCNGAQLVSVH
jgi:hypothetical protein